MLQIPRCLSLAIGASAVCLLASCAQQQIHSGTAAKTNLRRMQHVRTTAYTHTERGGRHNALDKRLAGQHLMSAASDWSRFPLGTHFRIVETNEEYIIDDYGTALIGTNTIDLYKKSRLEMRRWGMRHVDIDILEWGSDEESLKVLGPRTKHRSVRQMVLALNRKKTETVAAR